MIRNLTVAGAALLAGLFALVGAADAQDTTSPPPRPILGDLLAPPSAPPSTTSTPPPVLDLVPRPSPPAAAAVVPPPVGLPELLAPASARPGPGRVWTLRARTLTLHGMRYHGHEGEFLLLTATSVEITGLRQRALLPDGSELGISSDRAVLSPGPRGVVELRVQRMTAQLPVAGELGVPLTLATPLLPDTPQAAALRLPELELHDVTAQLERTAAGRLWLDDARITTG